MQFLSKIWMGSPLPLASDLSIHTKNFKSYAPIRMASRRQKITVVGEDVGEKEPLNTVGGNVKWSSDYGKQ